MKIDLHVHTSEVSCCGQISAKDTVALYKEKGYDAIVITNHFNTPTAEFHKRFGRDDFSAYYLQMYEEARKAGEEKGLLVLNGYELKFDCCKNDFLVYGMSGAIAREYDKLFKMTPREFSVIAKENGFLFYQAHPFRNGMEITDPGCLFGIETKNGCIDHDSRNDMAKAWAEKFGLHGISGSDSHRAAGVGTAGIMTDRSVKTAEDLVSVLRSDDYRII